MKPLHEILGWNIKPAKQSVDLELLKMQTKTINWTFNQYNTDKYTLSVRRKDNAESSGHELYLYLNAENINDFISDVQNMINEILDKSKPEVIEDETKAQQREDYRQRYQEWRQEEVYK